MAKTISIIVPLFNRAELVGETIQSVINQTYPHWELIIVDDGSTDGSKEVVEKLAGREGRVKLFCRTGLCKGAPVCRNQGVDLATGDYVIFLDSDDVLAPWNLQQRVEYMESNPDIDFAVFPILLFYKRPCDSNVLWNVNTEKSDLLRFIGGDAPWQTSSPIWRKTAVAAVGHWDVSATSWQDWEYFIRALVKKLSYHKVSALPDVFYRNGGHKKISSSWSMQKDVEYKLALHRLWIKIYNFLQKEGETSKEYKRLLAGHYFRMANTIAVDSVPLNASDFFEVVHKEKMVNRTIYIISRFYLSAYQYLRKKTIRLLPALLYFVLGRSLMNLFYFEDYFRDGVRKFKSVTLPDEVMNKVKMNYLANFKNKVDAVSQ